MKDSPFLARMPDVPAIGRYSAAGGLADRGVVYVVDDDVSVREGVGGLMALEGWTVRIFDNATAFLAEPRSETSSCLILDLNLPVISGIELQSMMRSRGEELPIIFITGQGDIPSTVQAMKGGAVEFLTKPFPEDLLVSAVRNALERSRAALRTRRAREVLERRYATLTAREKEVMGHVVAGLLNKQIAFEMGITEITVKAHRGRVMTKMMARSLAELVRMSAELYDGTLLEPSR